MPMKTHKNYQNMIKTFSSATDCIPKNHDEFVILKERAKKIAQVGIKKIQEQDTFSYVHFRLGENEHYGIPYQLTKEVIQNTPITYIPCTLQSIAGVINRRGKLINVIDLKKLFGMKNSTKEMNQNVIVVQNKLMQVGLLVDSFEGSNHCILEKLNQPIPSNNAINPGYIMGLHKKKIAIINIDTLLTEIEMQLIK